VTAGEAVTTALLVAGGGLCVVSVIGVSVMRSFEDRVHYVGLAGYGGLLVGAAVLVEESFSLIGNKALAVGAFLMLTGPVLAHATVRSGRIRRLGDWRAAEDEEGPGR
jgi:multicomponent Na+:H+ antiporter subunit G